MKKLLTLLITLTCMGVNAQELFTVSGTIQYLSYHQGGVELPPEMMQPVASPNEQLFIIQYFGSTEKSKIITPITSDKNGRFEVKLPPGKYGFIKYKSESGRGVYLPGMAEYSEKLNDTIPQIEYDFTGIDHQDYWMLSTNGPFEVVNQDLTNVTLTHYDISICYMCP